MKTRTFSNGFKLLLSILSDGMKAVILAGGYSKRLRPITDRVPKPLVEVGGKPIVEWELEWLVHCGMKSFVFLVGYLKDKVFDYVNSRADELGITVEYAIEETPLGTAGALNNARKLLQDEKEFVMMNGDTISSVDVRNIELGGAVAALALVQLRSSYGITMLDGDRITKFDEKPVLSEYWMNTGIYLMSSRIFDYLPQSGNLESTTFTQLASKKMLRGVKFPDAYFKGVDSIKDMEEVSADLESERAYGGVLKTRGAGKQ